MTSAERPAFTRPPLLDATRQIRLLKIFRDESALGYTDTIRCELSVHYLSDVEGKFTAISYTWGPTTPLTKIIIDGIPVLVRTHCWYALWQVRLHDAASTQGQDNLYWIDSISIDQDCHSEKGQQISQMGSIYEGAGLVAVCLGFPGQDNCLFPRGNNALEIGSTFDYQQAASHLAHRSYFQRVWTVQECSLAQRKVAFCGPARISWHTIAAIISKTAERRALQVFFRPAAPGGEDSLTAFPGKLLQNLTRKCFDPRDKLYGVLHLSKDFSRMIQPDYSKDLTDVFLEYVWASTSLCRWPMGPAFSHMLINSIRSLALAFEWESPGFSESLQALLNKGFFDASTDTWCLPGLGLSARCPKSPEITLYYAVRPHYIVDDIRIVSRHNSEDTLSAENSSIPLWLWSLPPEFTKNTFTDTMLRARYFWLGPLSAHEILSSQVFCASNVPQPRDTVLAFDTVDGLAIIARDLGVNGEIRLRTIAESLPEHQIDMSRHSKRRELIVLHSDWLCGFSVTPSELLGLCFAANDQSQLLRILCRSFLGRRGFNLVHRSNETLGIQEADRQSAIYHEEAAWQFQQSESSVRPSTKTSITTPLESGPCLQDAFDCCGSMDPTWLALDGHTGGERGHKPSCPWLQHVRPFDWKAEDSELDDDSSKQDRRWITKFPPS